MKRSKHAVIETVASAELEIKETQEVTRSSALDHAMVVGRGDEHRLANAQKGEFARRNSSKFRGVIHCAYADDDALAIHQTRNGSRCSNGSGVRECDRCALVVFSVERASFRA